MEQHRRGDPTRVRARRPGQTQHVAQVPQDRICRPGRRDRARAAPAERRRRIRPGLRRWPGARLGGPDRRRAGRRQIDPADPGCRRAWRSKTPGPADRLHLRRGSGRAVAPARAAARPGRRPGTAGGRDLGARHRRQPGRNRRAGRRGRRFDPDALHRQPGIRAGHGVPGARQRAGADPARQAARLRAAPGRPCHQGRPAGRAQGAGAHGRYGADLRGRARPSLPDPAGQQEPLWPDRRDRRLRNGRWRPAPGG